MPSSTSATSSTRRCRSWWCRTRASTSWPKTARRSRWISPAARCGSVARPSAPRSPPRSSRRWWARAASSPPSSTTARRSSRSSPRRLFGLYPGGEQKARDHVVAGDGANQLHHLIVGQELSHPVDGGLFRLHVARHLHRELEGGQLGGLEELGVRLEPLDGGELFLGASGLEELRLVLDPLVVGLVEDRDAHDGDLAQVARERELVADGREHAVPALGEVGAVQEHAVEVEQLAARPARFDGLDQFFWLRLVVGQVGNAGLGCGGVCGEERREQERG